MQLKSSKKEEKTRFYSILYNSVHGGVQNET